jgi:hypothetical protein
MKTSPKMGNTDSHSYPRTYFVSGSYRGNELLPIDFFHSLCQGKHGGYRNGT